MITIFTIPKAFEGHIGTIQRNAIRSWSLLEPACEIILCGDDSGVEAAAREFGARHVANLETSELGTPLLNSAFTQVLVEVARHKILCYVNADIILLDDLLSSLERVQLPQFLMVGRRLNLDLDQPWDFGVPDWRVHLSKLVTERGELGHPNSIDYFVFPPNGKLENLPPFAVGRPGWDNWFIYHARQLGLPVIDGSRVVSAIHQNHDYAHIPLRSGPKWHGPEAQRNRQLKLEAMGGIKHSFSVLDATHVMTPRRLFPAISPDYLLQRWSSLPALHAAAKPFVYVLHPLFLVLKKLRLVLQKR